MVDFLFSVIWNVRAIIENFTFGTPRQSRSHENSIFEKFDDFFERELFRLNGLVLKPCYLNVPEQNGL